MVAASVISIGSNAYQRLGQAGRYCTPCIGDAAACINAVELVLRVELVLCGSQGEVSLTVLVALVCSEAAKHLSCQASQNVCDMLGEWYMYSQAKWHTFLGSARATSCASLASRMQGTHLLCPVIHIQLHAYID